MIDYQKEYQKLNASQRQAVDTIEGPLLVIAGPGTGKTQLLSARVAHILNQTDTLPQNILCLTFTETGAENMRERLTRFVGQAAYDVNISTYHAFGGDLIRRFPEYFAESRLQNPIDELGKHQILQAIVDQMSYLNPLKQTQHHLNDLISTVSEVKRALLGPKELRAIARENGNFIQDASQRITAIFESFTTMPRKLDSAIPYFSQTLSALEDLLPAEPVSPRFGSLAQVAVQDLRTALEDAETTGKTNPLTTWKNSWLVKDSDNHFSLGGTLENKRIEALADVCAEYQKALEERALYDFDDMILRSIEALQSNDDFRFTLQEQYLYLLLDEFQDTNAAQLRLIELLTNNPVHEGRPNVMAVGDDDQAIYAFQGAQYSNMIDFYHMYRDVRVVNLTENYRSHGDVLAAAEKIAAQIDGRLHQHFDGMSKVLRAANTSLPSTAAITRSEFMSDLAQYDWIARRIRELVDNGVAPKEIAVLAPRHKQLEPLVGYLNEYDLPVRYEKRENILETSVVKQLLTMSRLLLALGRNDIIAANALWPQVLSFDFWQLPTSHIWQLSWQVNDKRDAEPNWSKLLLDDSRCRPIALLMLALAARTELETCEAVLDSLIGSEPVLTNEADLPEVTSPLRSYYTDRQEQGNEFYETLSHLTVLRARLREHQQTQDNVLRLQDLIDFIAMYETAGERMLNTSPYSQAADAVQLMTVFKSKGLEFEHVFLVCCHDDVWGGSSRGNANRITLPANLRPIRYAGGSDDERLRILFVALTRAKYGLHLTSYKQTFAGKATKHLKYLNEQEQPDGNFRCLILPDNVQVVRTYADEAPVLELLQLDWRNRHTSSFGDDQLKSLLADRLKNYQLSPTHLNSFLDLEYGGPEKFFFNTILRFPQAPTINGQYGNAIHESLEWLQQQLNLGNQPDNETVISYFADRMRRKSMTKEQIELQIERGQAALRNYLSERRTGFTAGNKPEQNFKHEGVFIGDAHMAGKIDLLEIDTKNRTITVVDYKTGTGYDRWQKISKLHKYRQQLYCYKLLIEGSHTYQGYTVTGGRLEFVEPDNEGRLHQLDLAFDDTELNRTKQLITAMWHHVTQLNLPDVSSYTNDLNGTLDFESFLLSETP